MLISKAISRPFLRIARVEFVSEAAPPPPPDHGNYDNFLKSSPRQPGSLAVPTTFHRELKITRPTERVFQTGGAWFLARDGDDYTLCLDPPVPGGRATVLVRFNPFSAAGVSVHAEDLSVNPLVYPLDQMLLMFLLSCRAGAILHAAGFGLRGCGFAFIGRSGAGKTTLARLLQGRPCWQPLSDDRVIVRGIGGEDLLFGTPWPGEAGIARDDCFPLGGLCFLRQGKVNRLEPLSAREALERLLPVASIPWFDRDAAPPVLDFLGAVAAAHPAWELVFRDGPTLPPFLEANLPAPS